MPLASGLSDGTHVFFVDELVPFALDGALMQVVLDGGSMMTSFEAHKKPPNIGGDIGKVPRKP